MSLYVRFRRHAVWLAILLTLASWSYAAIWAANSSVLIGFYAGRYVTWTLGFLGLALGIAGFTYRFSPTAGRVDRSYAMGAAGLLLFQSSIVFEDLHGWLSSRSGSLPAAAVVALIAAAILVLTYRVSDASSIRMVFAVLALVLVAVPALEIVKTVLDPGVDSIPLQTPPPTIDAAESSGDVFVVVLDAYGRSDVLERQFGFDNTPFESALADLGVFVLRGVKSNYAYTEVSVTSLLDARYTAVGHDDDPSLFALRDIYAGDNALFGALDAADYQIHFFDNAWTFTQCGPIVDHCYSTVLNEIDHVLAQRTPLPYLIDSLRIDPWTRESVAQLREAASLAEAPSDRKRFVFVHALIPHAPFQLDESCEEYWNPRLDGYGFEGESPADSGVRRKAYVAQLRCTNSLILELIAAIPRDAIVFVTADHGPRPIGVGEAPSTGTATDEILARFGTFTAYRFPEECEAIPHEVSLIEAAAGLFGCLGIPVTDEPARTPVQPARYFRWELVDGGVEVTDITSSVAPAR